MKHYEDRVMVLERFHLKDINGLTKKHQPQEIVWWVAYQSKPPVKELIRRLLIGQWGLLIRTEQSWDTIVARSQ